MTDPDTISLDLSTKLAATTAEIPPTPKNLTSAAFLRPETSARGATTLADAAGFTPLSDRLVLIDKFGEALLQRIHDLADITVPVSWAGVPADTLAAYDTAVTSWLPVPLDQTAAPAAVAEHADALAALATGVMAVLREQSAFQDLVVSALAELNSLNVASSIIASVPTHTVSSAGHFEAARSGIWQLIHAVARTISLYTRAAFAARRIIASEDRRRALFAGMCVLGDRGVVLDARDQPRIIAIQRSMADPLAQLRRKATTFAPVITATLIAFWRMFGASVVLDAADEAADAKTAAKNRPDARAPAPSGMHRAPFYAGWLSEASPLLAPIWAHGLPDVRSALLTADTHAAGLAHTAFPLPPPAGAAGLIDGAAVFLTAAAPDISAFLVLGPLLVPDALCSPEAVDAGLPAGVAEAVIASPVVMAGTEAVDLQREYATLATLLPADAPAAAQSAAARAAAASRVMGRRARGQLISRRMDALAQVLCSAIGRRELVPPAAPALIALARAGHHLLGAAYAQPADLDGAAVRRLVEALALTRAELMHMRVQTVAVWAPWLSETAITARTVLAGVSADLVAAACSGTAHHRTQSRLIAASLDLVSGVGEVQAQALDAAYALAFVAASCGNDFNLATSTCVGLSFIDPLRPQALRQTSARVDGHAFTDLPSADPCTLLYMQALITSIDKCPSFVLLHDDSAHRLRDAAISFIQRVFQVIRDYTFETTHGLLSHEAARVLRAATAASETASDAATDAEKRAEKKRRRQLKKAMSAAAAGTHEAGTRMHEASTWKLRSPESIARLRAGLTEMITAITSLPPTMPIGDYSSSPGLMVGIYISSVVALILRGSIPKKRELAHLVLPPSIFRTVAEAVIASAAEVMDLLPAAFTSASLRAAFLPPRLASQIAAAFGSAVLPPPPTSFNPNPGRIQAHLLAPQEMRALGQLLGPVGSRAFLQHIADTALAPAITSILTVVHEYGARLQALAPRAPLPPDAPLELFQLVQPALTTIGLVVQVAQTVAGTAEVTDLPVIRNTFRAAVPDSLFRGCSADATPAMRESAQQILRQIPIVCAAIFRRTHTKKVLFKPQGAAAAAAGIAPFFNTLEFFFNKPANSMLYQFSKAAGQILSIRLHGAGQRVPYGPDQLPHVVSLGESLFTTGGDMARDIDQDMLETLTQVVFLGDSVEAKRIGLASISQSLVRAARRVLTEAAQHQ